VVAEANPEVDAVMIAQPEPEPEASEPERPKLEPLEPRSKRRWFRRRAEEPQPEPEPPPVPKHVRLLPTPPRQDGVAAELSEIDEAPEREGGAR
jgi:hypothetical protein